MAQKTISELEEVPSSRPTPISVSLMAKVIKFGHVAKFKTSNGEEAEMITSVKLTNLVLSLPSAQTQVKIEC